MGLWNSFKGQVGRDTGRVLSNFIYKDSHASVYRRAKSRDNKKEQKKEEVEINHQEFVKMKKTEIHLSKSIDEKINIIVNLDIPESDKEILGLLNKLSILMTSNPFNETDEDDASINNRYSEAILCKYEQVLYALICLNPSDLRVTYYTKEFRKFKRNKIWNKYKGPFLGVIALATVMLISGLGILLS